LVRRDLALNSYLSTGLYGDSSLISTRVKTVPQACAVPGLLGFEQAGSPSPAQQISLALARWCATKGGMYKLGEVCSGEIL
jgi:hypothetical protein